jgi:hypothetical protein
VAIERQRVSDKFTWKPDDLVFSDEVSMPDNIKNIADNIPQGDEAVKHLDILVNKGEITQDEMDFILQVMGLLT